MTPPTHIDNAKTLLFAWSGTQPFGFVGNTNDSQKEEIFGLAICQYEGEDSFYRFSCNKDWETIQDGFYNSIAEAIAQLPDQYKNVQADWKTM